jgi:hypothetical protein
VGISQVQDSLNPVASSILLDTCIKMSFANHTCQVPNPRKTGTWETLFYSVTEQANGTRLAFAT